MLTHSDSFRYAIFHSIDYNTNPPQVSWSMVCISNDLLFLLGPWLVCQQNTLQTCGAHALWSVLHCNLRCASLASHGRWGCHGVDFSPECGYIGLIICACICMHFQCHCFYVLLISLADHCCPREFPEWSCEIRTLRALCKGPKLHGRKAGEGVQCCWADPHFFTGCDKEKPSWPDRSPEKCHPASIP